MAASMMVSGHKRKLSDPTDAEVSTFSFAFTHLQLPTLTRCYSDSMPPLVQYGRPSSGWSDTWALPCDTPPRSSPAPASFSMSSSCQSLALTRSASSGLRHNSASQARGSPSLTTATMRRSTPLQSVETHQLKLHHLHQNPSRLFLSQHYHHPNLLRDPSKVFRHQRINHQKALRRFHSPHQNLSLLRSTLRRCRHHRFQNSLLRIASHHQPPAVMYGLTLSRQRQPGLLTGFNSPSQ